MGSDFFSYTLLIVTLGSVALGIMGGLFGGFLSNRRQSMIGDAIAHASFPGVVLAFLLSGKSDITTLLLGAAIASVISMALINIIGRLFKHSIDGTMALTMAGMFGLGQVILRSLSYLRPGSNQSSLDGFIFGEAATMLKSDALFLWIMTLVTITIIIFFKKELSGYSFDGQFMRISGFSSYLIEFIFSFLTIVVIVIGLSTVGVVLISSLIAIPYIAAKHWVKKFNHQLLVASLLGAIAGLIGPIFATLNPLLPPGPTIILVLAIITFLSFIFGKYGSLLSHLLNKKILDKKIKMYPMRFQYHLLYPIPIKDEDLMALKREFKVLDSTSKKEIEKMIVEDKLWVL
ncbi:MAG TPA: metal ABC transporter permease [Bacilli bacterium]|nr:metal ABC transporter permease [Bacilli bacterium]